AAGARSRCGPKHPHSRTLPPGNETSPEPAAAGTSCVRRVLRALSDGGCARRRTSADPLAVRMATPTVGSSMRVEQLLQDVRFGARILAHAPGLSAAAIILIALVIGGNATVYSMVNSILVSPASGVTRADLVV